MFRKVMLFAAACLAPFQAHAENRAKEFSGRLVATAGADIGRHESTDVLVGASGGVDYSLNEETFIGVEASLTQAFTSSHHHWFHDDDGRTSGALAVRGGIVFAPRTKAYALAGIRISAEDQSSIYGLGVEREFGRLLANFEYRQASDYRSDQIILGLGVHF